MSDQTQPPARFRYALSMNRKDGRWVVAAEFDGDPSKSSEPPPSQYRTLINEVLAGHVRKDVA